MNKLRFIHVGTGDFGMFWGRNIIPKIAPFAECVAAVDIDAQAIGNFKTLGLLPGNKHYTDLRTALAENKCDFLIVVTMPNTRMQIIDLAIEYGIMFKTNSDIWHLASGI